MKVVSLYGKGIVGNQLDELLLDPSSISSTERLVDPEATNVTLADEINALKNVSGADSYSKVEVDAMIESVNKRMDKSLSVIENQLHKLYDGEPITIDGTYDLTDAASKYSCLVVNFEGSKFEDVRDTIDLNGNVSIIPQSPPVDEFVVTASSTYPGYFTGKILDRSTNVAWCSAQGQSAEWIQVESVNGPLSFDTVVIYHGLKGYPNYTATNLKVKGSNDGVTWDDLVSDPEAHTGEVTPSGFYLLNSRVSYKYVRVDVLEKGSSGHVHVSELLLQDSTIHKYVNDDLSLFTHESSLVGSTGTFVFSGSTVEVSNLNKNVKSIFGINYDNGAELAILREEVATLKAQVDTLLGTP